MFLVETMERVACGVPSSSAASEAYSLVLSPFHTLSTRALAGTVLTCSPSFEGVSSSLLIDASSSLRRVGEAVDRLLSENGAVFQEKL